MFESVNRDVLLVYPKKPLIDWVNYIFPDNPVTFSEEMGHDDGTIFLLPEKGSVLDTIDYLKRNYKPIFEHELFDWCEDKSLWPQKLTWQLFEEWFYYSIQTMVMDTVHGKISKEEY